LADLRSAPPPAAISACSGCHEGWCEHDEAVPQQAGRLPTAPCSGCVLQGALVGTAVLIVPDGACDDRSHSNPGYWLNHWPLHCCQSQPCWLRSVIQALRPVQQCMVLLLVGDPNAEQGIMPGFTLASSSANTTGKSLEEQNP
jgi:hypothetical protein